MADVRLMLGDSLERLKELADNSVDSVVTDPPYGLAFMGKKWDYDVPSVELWREVLRVLKPGGHLLSFGGTRTYHRMVVAIEDAGFEIRDQICWLYGSGFPKSMDVSKAIDKAAGAERKVIGENPATAGRKKITGRFGGTEAAYALETEPRVGYVTAPATPDAKRWQGWGTALKPANEPIVLARKPLSEKTVAKNVLKHGTGAINVDASRIGSEQLTYESRLTANTNLNDDGWSKIGERAKVKTVQGRWPANVLFDEEAAAMLDEQSGVLKSGALKGDEYKDGHVGKTVYGQYDGFEFEPKAANSGGASRFFYVAKASKRERNQGLSGAEYALKSDAPEWVIKEVLKHV